MMMNSQVEIRNGEGVQDVAGEDTQDRLIVLHRRLTRIAKARAQLDLQEAEALREAQKLGLWRKFGYASLAEYMERELGYSTRNALERLRVANALPELPKLTEALQSGDLNFSQVREIVRVATPETEQVWIEKTCEMNVREIEEAVAGHEKGDLPDDPVPPGAKRRKLWLDVREDTYVLFREARAALEKARGEKVDEDSLLEAVCRFFLSNQATGQARRISESRGDEAVMNEARAHVCTSATHELDVDADQARVVNEARAHVCTNDNQPTESRQAGAAPYRVAVTVCKRCKRGWQHGGGAIAEMTPPAVERALCDAQFIGDVDDATLVERARQAIPPATRRKVQHRDQGCCRVPGCRSYVNLDIHHIVHVEHGGTNELSNLITLCEAHHLAHHDGTLSITRVGVNDFSFKFEGRNKFTRVTRELATKKALRERGFDREQVRSIMARAINHIGETSLSEEQWLTIALGYANELAS